MKTVEELAYEIHHCPDDPGCQELKDIITALRRAQVEVLRDSAESCLKSAKREIGVGGKSCFEIHNELYAKINDLQYEMRMSVNRE